MGSAFSLLSGLRRRRRSAFGVVNWCPFSNQTGDVDSRQNENKDQIRIEDSPNGDDSRLYRNQGDNCVERGDRALMESPNAVSCTNNIDISNVHNVVTGDHTTINIQASEQRMENVAVVYATIESEERNTVSAVTQIPLNAVTNTISIPDSYIVAIGNITFTSDQTSHREQPYLNIPRAQSYPSLLLLPPTGVQPRIAKVFHVMCTIVNQLYPLRDRGEWPEFEEALLQLHMEYNRHPEIKCLLLLEESVELTYQKRLKAAKRKVQQCLTIVNNEASNISGASHDLLVVLANVTSAGIFRRLPKRKLGKAFECLEDAKESAERLSNVNSTMPKLALAFLDYELARYHMTFATMTNDTTHCNREEACKMLARCIDRFRKLANESNLYTARDSFALLHLARMSLPSTCNFHSQPGQRERLNKRSARQAEKHLQEYRRSHRDLENSPRAATVMYWSTESTLYVLKGNYASARDLARQALETAVKYGFELETVPAQTHLDQISRHDCASMTRRHDKLLVVKALPSGYSSSTTTDSDRRAT